MRSLLAVPFVLLGLGVPASHAKDSLLDDPASLAAEIERMKPEKDVWREVSWRTCPLDALAEARKEGKPVLAWVFLGNPSDERC